MEGSSKAATIIVVHGYGTSPLDLAPVAECLKLRGYGVRVLCIPGHWPEQYNQEVSYSRWYDVVLAAAHQARGQSGAVYVLGFSLGGTVALELAIDGEIDGAIAISPFLSPIMPRAMKATLSLLRIVRVERLPRFIQTTVRSVRGDLKGWSHFRILTLIELLNALARNKSKFMSRHPTARCLVLHSRSDRVARYVDVLKMAVRHSGSTSLLSFSRLKHVLQFDLPTNVLVDAIDAWCINASSERDDEAREHDLMENHKDSVQWAETLFRLVFGFFTVFAVTIGLTIEGVVTGGRQADIVLVTYSLLLNFYLGPTMLYGFYLARTDMFRRMYLETSGACGRTPWVRYRTNRYGAGLASAGFTTLFSVIGLAVPLLIAVYLAASSFSLDGVLNGSGLHIAAAASLFMSVVNGFASVVLARFVRTALYKAPPINGSATFIRCAVALQACASPGSGTRVSNLREEIEAMVRSNADAADTS